MIDFFKNLFFPYTNRVYLVGGYVRDQLLGNTSKDIDIEVYDIDLQTFEKLMNKIGAKGVGKSYFVYKYKNYDISLPRTETKISNGHKGFSVEICQDEKLASKRRDFSINAIMKNIFTNEILDFWGGLEDLKTKTLKHIDDKTFKEDSLRVLRAMQFANRFHFKVDPKTVQICQNIKLDDLSNERIYMEFEKMFNSPTLHYGFYYFIKLKIAKKLLNLDFTYKEFIHLSKIYKTNPIPSYFFYQLRVYKKLKSINIDMPKALQKEIQTKKLPKKVTNKFLYGLSLKYPLKTFSLLNNNYFKDFLIENNIYEKKYKPKIIDSKNPRKSILQEIRNFDKIIIKN
jgi:tRNA nucleotidyltransferase (CCA-adding enzyme)